MWETTHDDTTDTTGHAATSPAEPLTHEMPCVRCGHPPHLFLACDRNCDCEPEGMPGDRLTG